jgi:uncharacterized protein involved in cysteine biosynthesis
VSGFALGFFTYFRGLQVWLRSGALLRLSIVPWVLDAFCMMLGLYYAGTHVGAVTASFWSLFARQPEHWYQFALYYGLYALTGLSLFFLVILFVVIFANLIVFPINDSMAEKTLRLEGAVLPGTRGARAWAGKSIRNTLAMVEKAAVLLGAGSLLTLGALLIPGFGFIAAAAGVFLIAIDRMDYACDQYQMGFGARMSLIRANFATVAGFATALGLMTAIPFVNVLLMPGGVVAGACLVAQLRRGRAA